MIALMAFVPTGAWGSAEAETSGGTLDPALRDRVKASIDVGLRRLRFQQDRDGSWGGGPRATALVLRALAESHRQYSAEDGPFVRRAQQYLAGALEADAAGAESLSLESAAAAMQALRHSHEPAHQELLGAAGRRLRSRLAAGDGGGMSGPFQCAGLGLVVEALRSSPGPTDSAVWQQLGRVARACEGDAALRDLIASDLGRAPSPGEGDLPAAVRRALPGTADRAVPYEHYYFLVDALNRHGRPVIVDGSGASRAWRTELARSLTERQRGEGDWAPEGIDPNENETVVATAFAVLALERLYEDPVAP